MKWRSWYMPALAFTLVLATAVTGFPTAQHRAYAATPPMQNVTISDFETARDDWGLSLGEEFPGAAGSFTVDAAEQQEGASSGKLVGDFTGGGMYVSVGKDLASVDIEELSFWVKTADLDSIGLRLIDGTGQTHQQTIGLKAETGWQQVVVTQFDGGMNSGHWGGADDGVWHGPAQRIELMLDSEGLSGGKKSGTLWLDNIVGIGPKPAINIKQAKLGNIFTVKDKASFTIETWGDHLAWSATDFWGNQVAGKTEAVTGTSATIRLPKLDTGYYTFRVAALSGASTIKEAETSFAIMPKINLSKTSSSPFGVATHFGQDWNTDLIPLLEQAGMKNIRDDTYWQSVEPQKGVYAFPSEYDAFYKGLEDHGIDPLTVLAYTHPEYDNDSAPYTDEGRKGFADYGNAVLDHYKQVKWIEVYNEFNITGNGPADSKPEYYYKLLEKTYQTVKASHPDKWVIGPVTASIPWEWLEQLFQLGGLKYMDAISVHPYRYPAAPETLEGDIAKLNDLIKKYNNGKTKPIWITEIGWPTESGSRGVGENIQADYAVRSNVEVLSAGVQKLYWYDFMNDGIDKADNESNFGLIRNPMDPLGKYTPKPAYVAYGIMTQQLDNKRFLSKDTVGDGIYSYVFGNSDGKTRVLWSTSPKQVKLKSDDVITVTDMMGVKTKLRPAQGNYVYLTVTEDPVYISADDSLKVQQGSKFSLTGGDISRGEPVKISLAVDNTQAPKEQIKGTLQIGGQSVPIDVKQGEKKTIPITLPTANLDQTIFGTISIDGHSVAILSADVHIVEPLIYNVKHVLAGDKDTVRVFVTNNQSHDYLLNAIDWQFGTKSGVLNPALTIPSHSQGKVDVPITDLAIGQVYDAKLTLNAQGVAPYTYTGKVAAVDIPSMTQALQKTVVIDGTLDDMTGVPYVDLANGVVQISSYGGPNDLSGKIQVNWDADNLYISADIHDDVLSQSYSDDLIWQGDSIQFAISPSLPGESPEWSEFGMALTSQGPQVYRWFGMQGHEAGLVLGAQLKVTRNESTKSTAYELAVPWTELSPLQPDDGLFSLSLLVNDNDGTGRKGYMEWGSGIGGEKNDAFFKPIRLVKPQ